MSNAKPAERRKCVSPAPATRASSLSPWSRRPLPSRALFGTHRSPRPPRPRRSLFRAKAPPQAPLEPVNVNYRAQVRANADTRLPDVHPGIPPSSHPRVSDAHFKNRLPSDARARSPLVPRPRQAAPSAPAPRGAATPKAHREVVVEDGFKYKRRKSGTPGARAGPSSNRVSGGAIVLKSEKSDKRDVSQRLSSSLPPDYPGLGVHERVPEDLPEEERMQMLIEEICELECKVERERLIKDFGPNDGAAMASALERACSEFQLKVEELVVRGDVQFDVSTTALREMRDAKEEAMRAVASQLEDEAAQWRALQAQAEGANGTTEDLVTRADAVEAAESVRRTLASEMGGAGLAPGAVATSVEEAKRRLEMQAEGLNAMVEGTEALCVRAERAAAVFSAALAEHDYRGLPHVHSPANLVKNLISFAKK
jgi:hypothetical protein